MAKEVVLSMNASITVRIPKKEWKGYVQDFEGEEEAVSWLVGELEGQDIDLYTIPGRSFLASVDAPDRWEEKT